MNINSIEMKFDLSVRNGPAKPIRNISISNTSQPMVVRHVFASSRGIPVTMSVVPSYTSEVSLKYLSRFNHDNLNY